MDSNDLFLYARGPGAPPGIHLGRLAFRGISPHQNALQLTIDFHQPHSQPPGGDPYFVELRAQTSANSQEPGPLWGRWEIASDQLPTFGANTVTTTWTWHLPTHDVEAIEAHHARTGQQRVTTLKLDVAGLMFVDGRVLQVRGDSYISFPRSEWEDKVLSPLGYRLPASWDRLMPDPERRDHPEWTDAEKRLDEARKSLRRGESRDALGATLDAFESILSQPYSAANWRTKLEKVPEDVLPKQKREAVADMLGGMCTYLNRVGHHRGKNPDSTNTLPVMPADQWEAEHVVAAAHFLLPLAMKLAAAEVVPTPPAASSTATAPTP